jgi:membrane protease YdiL (CAAX protease family)
MLLRLILEGILQVFLPCLIAILLLENKTKENYFKIFLVAGIYIVYQLILVITRFAPFLDFVKSSWNWEGKIFAIIFGIICYFICNPYFYEQNYFTLKQEKKSNQLTWIVTFSVILLVSVIAFILGKDDFNMETLAFQLIMPAFDEEIIYRGIFMGLLLPTLPKKSFLGNPAILITAILFGMTHAFSLSKKYEIGFDIGSFLHTGIGGYIFSWLAYQSKSILKPIIAHGGANFFAALATMLK